MPASTADRLTRMGYRRARLLLLGAGVLVLAVVCLVMVVRSVDTIEVIATLLFVPVLFGFLFKGLPGGIVTGLAAAAAYAALRSPAVDALGGASFAGIVASRSLSYLVFGVVGGWSSRVLESSLDKLDRYDSVDDATGLRNARFFLEQTELELARAERYQSMFSVVVLEIPAAPLTSLGRRKRAGVLHELGRQIGSGLRTVDHIAHAADGTMHRFGAILPETSAEGAEVFRARLVRQIADHLRSTGTAIPDGQVVARAATTPGDDDVLAAMRADFARVDELHHARPEPVRT